MPPTKKPRPKTVSQDADHGAKRVREGVNINVWLDADLGAAFERYMEETRPKPSRKAAVEAAIELLLIQAKRWPPPK